MDDLTCPDLLARLEAALEARRELFDPQRLGALRLFNGFYEGCPALVADLYARSLVLFNYAADPAAARPLVGQAAQYLAARLPWLEAILVKERHAGDPAARKGTLLRGSPDRRIREGGVWYALDLLLNQDASFYLDTRGLRGWIAAHLGGRRVLNTFAYTGSLGVTARAAGASQVVQLDRSRAFLNLAKESYTLNGFPFNKGEFVAADFFPAVARLKQAGALFDCAILDPPYFSVTEKGRVDLAAESRRVLNKVRPLVADGGYLVAVNNALFLSGEEYLQALQALDRSGCLAVEELIPVPQDITGYAQTITAAPPVDPAPFNHATKIAVLRVRRKDGRK